MTRPARGRLPANSSHFRSSIFRRIERRPGRESGHQMQWSSYRIAVSNQDIVICVDRECEPRDDNDKPFRWRRGAPVADRSV